MDELVERIVAKVGISRSLAETAVGIILDFLVRQAPAETVNELLTHLPGAQAAIDAARNNGGMTVGGIMGVGMRLMGVGLEMEQIKSVTREIIAVAREKAGPEAVDRFAAAIPGLNQFI